MLKTIIFLEIIKVSLLYETYFYYLSKQFVGSEYVAFRFITSAVKSLQS